MEYKRKNGWMDGWTDGWTDGWMDGWMDGWIWMDVHGYACNKRMNGLLDGCLAG